MMSGVMTQTLVAAPARPAVARKFLLAAGLVTAVPWLLTLLMSQATVPGNGQLVVVLTIWLGIPHVATTAAFYADPAARGLMQGPRYTIVPVAAVLAGGIVGAMGGLTGLIVVNAFWTLHHFAKQNLGMVAFTSRALGAPGPDGFDRKVIVGTGVAAGFGYTSILFPVIGVDVATGWLEAVGLAILACCAACSWRSPCRWLMLAAAVFFLPLFLGLSPLAAVTAYTAAHGAQYLLMMGKICWPSRRLVAAMVGSFLLGGALLRSASAEWALGAVIGVTFAHFLIDAGIWKMTTPEKRTYIRGRFSFL